MHKLVVALVLWAACGVERVPLADYPSAVRDAYCGFFVSCGSVQDFETCRKLDVGFHFRLTASQRAALDAGKLRYDEDAAGRCVDALAKRSCDVTSQSYRAQPDACRKVLTGTLHDGDACADGSECISRQCETTACNMACCTGACVGDQPPGIAAAGESCESAYCDAASFCDDQAMMCVALRPREAFCTADAECMLGLGCIQGGTCAILPQLGQACSGPCRDEGTTCGSSGICVKVALAGGACVNSTDCARGYLCDATKHCSAGIALGQPCTPGQRCADDTAFCDVPDGQAAGSCVLPRPDGEPCLADVHCLSNTCDPTQHCAPEPVCI